MSQDSVDKPDKPEKRLSRRRFLASAGTAGVVSAVPTVLWGSAASASPGSSSSAGSANGGDGTPEQVHLTWGADPTSTVVVSWASPAPSTNPRVTYGEAGTAAGAGARRGPHRTVPAVQRIYTDGISGETVWTYHATLEGLAADSEFAYTVTADNDANRANPFSATFRTAPDDRRPFRFTSFGDLATPNSQWVLSYFQAFYAVDAVNSQKPLFHLLNGDLCYANLNPMSQVEVWRDFGNNNQRSAATLPWMPCPGNHELEFYNGPQGLDSYLTRYTLPDNGDPYFPGRWYSFRVGNVLFVSLNADDVIYQDCSAFVSGPNPLTPVPTTGNPPIQPGTSLYVPGYSHGRQTEWLGQTLAAARQDDSIDWIVVQMHECALSSSATGNGSDRGIREAWLPLFDQYEVDLVLCGHDHDYERSFPVRGFDSEQGWDATTRTPVETRRPHPVTTVDRGTFDTSEGTVHLILGGGGTSAPLDEYGLDSADGQREAKVFTNRNAPVQTGTPGVWTRAGADAREDAIWSASRDTSTGYGLAVFDVDPGDGAAGATSITVTYLHAAGADATNPNTGAHGGPTSDYSVFETFTLTRPRRDGARDRQHEMAGADRHH